MVSFYPFDDTLNAECTVNSELMVLTFKIDLIIWFNLIDLEVGIPRSSTSVCLFLSKFKGNASPLHDVC